MNEIRYTMYSPNGAPMLVNQTREELEKAAEKMGSTIYYAMGSVPCYATNKCGSFCNIIQIEEENTMEKKEINAAEYLRGLIAKPHEDVCKRLTDMYVRKNHDYGDAFSLSIDKWGYQAAAIRIGDKYNRFCTLIEKLEDPKVEEESLVDTLLDLANYAIMTVMELEMEDDD